MIDFFPDVRLQLTPRETQVLLIFKEGRRPTLRELADELGVSRARIWELADALVEKGFLIRGRPGSYRNLRLP